MGTGEVRRSGGGGGGEVGEGGGEVGEGRAKGLKLKKFRRKRRGLG